MEIQLHKSHRAMDSIIIRVVVSEFPNPCKVSLVQVFLEESKTVLQNCFRVVLVER